VYLDGKNGFDNILFDFDIYVGKKEYRGTLNTLGTFLHKNPHAYAVLSGFTDNIGTEAYNIRLSERRAKSVRRYLRKNYHIGAKRLLPYWYGYANPVADNSTAEGRQLNRRVTITLRKQ
jgi:OOP family OmpA-OmpF porin